MIIVVEKNKGANTSTSKNLSYNKREKKGDSCPSPFSWGAKKATALEQRIKNNVIRLLEAEFLPSATYQKDPRYCPYHIKGRTLEKYFTFRKNFEEKHKAGYILFKKELFISMISHFLSTMTEAKAIRWWHLIGKWSLKEMGRRHLRQARSWSNGSISPEFV